MGDPVAYGFDGQALRVQRVSIRSMSTTSSAVVPADVEYCYLTGPHFRNFAPPEWTSTSMEGHAYLRRGTAACVHVDARPAYIGINDYYRPFVYDWPRIEVDAPVGWIARRVCRPRRVRRVVVTVAQSCGRARNRRRCLTSDAKHPRRCRRRSRHGARSPGPSKSDTSTTTVVTKAGTRTLMRALHAVCRSTVNSSSSWYDDVIR